jgi:hypothetical protein
MIYGLLNYAVKYRRNMKVSESQFNLSRMYVDKYNFNFC